MDTSSCRIIQPTIPNPITRNLTKIFRHSSKTTRSNDGLGNATVLDTNTPHINGKHPGLGRYYIGDCKLNIGSANLTQKEARSQRKKKHFKMKSGGIPCLGSYLLPTEWYLWKPTCKETCRWNLKHDPTFAPSRTSS